MVRALQKREEKQKSEQRRIPGSCITNVTLQNKKRKNMPDKL